MHLSWHPPSLLLECTNVIESENCLVVAFTAISKSATCPVCLRVSTRIHSAYQRTIQDLPIGIQAVECQLRTRKWFCDNCSCEKKIFTERFEWLAPYKRKTKRVLNLLCQMAFTTSCVSAAKLAKVANLHVSHDTLLRLIRSYSYSFTTPTLIGIDDFALRKGNKYGTLICDHHTKRPIAILPI